MSSPMINNVVLLGCFFCYVFVFLLGIDSRFVDDHVFGILCNVSRDIACMDHYEINCHRVGDVYIWLTGCSTCH